jgi:hypothetical protein
MGEQLADGQLWLPGVVGRHLPAAQPPGDRLVEIEPAIGYQAQCGGGRHRLAD